MFNKWDYRYLDLAKFISFWSRDPSTKCGAAISRPDNTLASVGTNGFAIGVNDSEERWNDRPTKYSMVLHAEENAILLAREPLHGYSIYVYPMMPCSNCAARIIQSGIKRVITVEGTKEQEERWGEKMELSKQMFEEAGVSLNFMDY